MAQPESDERELQRVGGFRTVIAVEFDAKTIQTDASHRADNRVTLIDVPLAALLKHDKAFAASKGAKNWVDAAKVMNAAAGVKVEPKAEISVEFH